MNLDHLDTCGIPYELIEISQQVHTVKETAHILNCSPEMVLKSLLTFDARNTKRLGLFVIPGTKRLQFENAKKISQFEKIKLLPPPAVYEETGFSVGALPPWGYPPNISIFYDKDILIHKVAYAGSGDSKYLIKFRTLDLMAERFCYL